ncbi:MAG: cytochrome P450 [Myxococcales bacterium]|nr:cytochrome P450 [Myxococcales bacterium]
MPSEAPRDAPFAPGGRGLRAVLAFRRDPLAFLERATAAAGDLFRFRATSRVWVYVLRSPTAIHHVLVDHPERYTKRSRGYRKLREFLGEGLLTAEGERWRRQRRIAQPAFHRARIAGFAATMTAMTEAMLARWDALAAAGEAIDVDHEMTRLTLRIAGATLLSADVEGEAEAVGRAVADLNTWASVSMLRLLHPPLWVPIRTNRRALAGKRELDAIVYGIIGRRRATGEDPGDLLSMLMAAVDEESGERMSDVQLRDEVMTIFLAGHETTANALSWALYLLARHPEVAAEVGRAVAAALGGRAPTIDDLPALACVERVFKETLRLYPPAWSIGRYLAEDDVIDGLRIEAPAIAMVSPYLTHRDPKLWPDPERFDPDRFLPEAERARPRYAYLPFGGGPRVCIGNAFANVEGTLILAAVLQRVRPALVDRRPVEPLPRITLRPGRPIRMALRPAPCAP